MTAVRVVLVEPIPPVLEGVLALEDLRSCATDLLDVTGQLARRPRGPCRCRPRRRVIRVERSSAARSPKYRSSQ
jgi:hypothetical protein